MNIASWLHETARLNPQADALMSGADLRSNYRQFANTACALGAMMAREWGVRPGDRIGLFLKNRPEYLEILYAAWWIGAIVVPISRSLHLGEATWILRDCGAKLVFTDDPSLETADSGELGSMAVLVESIDFQALRDVPATPPRSLTDDTLAWLFYTSGTTGRPKGAMLSHGNLIALSLCYLADVDSVSSRDAILYAAPLSHGAGLYNFVHVRRGARHVVPKSQGFDPAEIFSLSAQLDRVCFFCVPTMIRILVEEARRSGQDGAGIRSIIYGGGPMYFSDIDTALHVFGPKFIQIYGQGESPMTITALSRDILADREGSDWRNRVVSVGTAQSAVEIRIVTPSMNDVASGQSGEIVVRGPAVMRGYWNDPDATQAAIVDNWLRTGDVGHLNDDGFLTLTDRLKDVVISGGVNIYPREIEEVLLLHPAVAEASVVGRPHDHWGEEVIAFVVTRQGAECPADVLDEWCRRHIAAFKRPKRYCFVQALPKSHYGKVLKTELRARLDEEHGCGATGNS